MGNPARFFYEAMGGVLVATREEPFHGVILSGRMRGGAKTATEASELRDH